MYSTFLTFVALFVAPALAGFAINSPTLTQCETSKISWEGTGGSYNLIAVAANDPCGDALVEIGDFTATSIQWKVTIPAGTTIQLSVADDNDNEAWSKNITVGASSDSSCVPASLLSSTQGGSTTSGSSTTGSSDTGSSTTGSSTTGSTDSSGSTDGTDSDGTPIVPVGAANAGTNKLLNAAPSVRQISSPVLALGTLVAVIALAL